MINIIIVVVVGIITIIINIAIIIMQDQDSAPQQSDLLLRLPEMNACFNKDSIEDIYTALKELDSQWSQATLKLLNGYFVKSCMTCSTPMSVWRCLVE